jgi:histone H3/H4
MSDNLIVRSNIKNIVEGYNISGDFGDALNEKVKAVVLEAVSRAEANGRRTVMPKDL